MTMTELPVEKFQLTLSNKADLYANYMPFLKNGGLFIKTDKKIHLQTRVAIQLKLLDETEDYLIEGTVVWINPKFAQANLPEGVGIQFTGKNSQQLCNKFESCLDDFIDHQAHSTM